MRRGILAPALTLPYPSLARAGLRLRRGQLSLTVAAPSAGKSQLWQNIAHRSGEPTLYWSADTDQHDVTMRAIALRTGYTIGQVEEYTVDTNQKWEQHVDTAMERSSHIDWVFDSPITPRLIEERVLAFAERHGEYPHLTVLDNLSNAITDPSQEYSQIKEVIGAMQTLARKTGSHVAVLHHAKGEYDSGTRPIPQSGGLQNPFKLPEVGITLHQSTPQVLGVNIVKNRGGQSDPSASNPIYLDVDFSRATVKGYLL